MVLFCCSAALSCEYSALIWSPEKSADALYRIVRDGKVGYIDGTGKVVIEPTFEADDDNLFGDFHNGRLLVSEHKKESWRQLYVDSKGRPIIESDAYDYATPFSEGMAWVEKRGPRSLSGYIDVSGHLVIPLQFDQADRFSEGMAMVETKERAGYINKDGTFALPPRYLRGRSFHEGRAWVIAEGPCRIEPAICDYFVLPNSTVKGGLQELNSLPGAMESFLALPVCAYAVIDTSGATVSGLRFHQVQDFSEGLAAVKVDESWGYIDRNGEMAIHQQFSGAGPFSEGMAYAAMGSSPLGFIDASGSFVITPQFAAAEPFSEGFAVVSDGKRYWYIDSEGRNPFSKTFEAAGSFFKGLAHVKTAPGKPDRPSSGTFAYIDRSGKTIFTYQNQEKD